MVQKTSILKQDKLTPAVAKACVAAYECKFAHCFVQSIPRGELPKNDYSQFVGLVGNRSKKKSKKTKRDTGTSKLLCASKLVVFESDALLRPSLSNALYEFIVKVRPADLVRLIQSLVLEAISTRHGLVCNQYPLLVLMVQFHLPHLLVRARVIKKKSVGRISLLDYTSKLVNKGTVALNVVRENPVKYCLDAYQLALLLNISPSTAAKLIASVNQ